MPKDKKQLDGHGYDYQELKKLMPKDNQQEIKKWDKDVGKFLQDLSHEQRKCFIKLLKRYRKFVKNER